MSLFDTGIRPAVDNWLLQKSREVRDYGDYWSASSAGYCHRRLIFERLGIPHIEKDDDARKQRVFTSGHLFHEWIQGITKDAGLSIAQEVELQDEDLMIRGHFDDLVLIKDVVRHDELPTDFKPATGDLTKLSAQKDTLILYDYKTAHSKWFEYVKGRPMSYYNKMQLGTYMYMLKKKYDARAELYKDYMIPHEITEARILKISKDDLRMSEEQLMWSDELEKEIVGYWNDLNAAWGLYEAQGTLPDCTCADHEGGFLAKEAYNPYFKDGKPCSIKVYEEWRHATAKI